MNPVIATGRGVRKLSGLFKNDLYKCALLGSFVLSLISFLGIPAVLRYGELHRDIWRALLAAGSRFDCSDRHPVPRSSWVLCGAAGASGEDQAEAFFPTLKAGRCVRMRFRSGSARMLSSLRRDFFRPVFFLTEISFFTIPSN